MSAKRARRSAASSRRRCRSSVNKRRPASSVDAAGGGAAPTGLLAYSVLGTAVAIKAKLQRFSLCGCLQPPTLFARSFGCLPPPAPPG
jgi:hypothetical protein